MATVDITQSGTSTGHPSPRGTRQPYIIEVLVKGSEAATAKGAILADADIIQVLDIPAESRVLSGGAELMVADSEASDDITMDIGYGSDADAFVDAADPGGSVGYFAPGSGGNIITTAFDVATADTIDIVLGKTTTFASQDDWEVRVFMLVMDISGLPELGAARDNP